MTGIGANELAYLRLLRNVLKKGEHSDNRTGVPTRVLFGEQMRFSLHDGKLPLITTRRVNFRAITAELIWFLSGSTDQRVLERQNVRIWRENSSPAYLERVGLADRYRPYRDLGPIYAHQWRHFGAPYVNCETDYESRGVDQIASVIDQLRNDPTSRRIILSAWNPMQLTDMTLPPCHCLAQFHVRGTATNSRRLSCQLYQRSADLALGVPFNIASYSLLTHILATMCGYESDEFIHVIGNAHIYETHVPGIEQQIQRIPYAQPRLHIRDTALLTLENFTSAAKNHSLFDRLCDNFELINYKCHDRITFKMVP